MESRLRIERLERRDLLTSVPFGASADDTAEFMLGDVLVSVVLMESDGGEDANLEDWSSAQIDQVKQRVQEGLRWWEELLQQQSSVHSLNFQIDFTRADQPVATRYEPIARPSDDFTFWLDDFFQHEGITDGSDFNDRIRQFNHRQRLEHSTNWAFTIFVVNAANDPDHRFDSEGSFGRSFAFAGGRFFVTTSERPASSFAHEAGHMFWALDEYAGGAAYSAHRGYYDVQNQNALDGHPNPSARERSIMDSHGIAFVSHSASTSALEMIGWRDSDGDGIFDVLDVPHQLTGSGEFDALSSSYRFTGQATVQTLPNRNPQGQGNDITLNKIRQIEVRFDESSWQTVAGFDSYQVDLDFVIDVPPGTSQIELRALDDRTGVASNSILTSIDPPPPSWQNPFDPLDVSGDQIVTPLDALLVINELNNNGARALPPLDAAPDQYLDVNGDQFVSALDALLVINDLNSAAAAARANSVFQPAEANLGECEYDFRSAPAARERLSIDEASRRVNGRVPSQLHSRGHGHVHYGFGGDELPLAPIRNVRWIDLALDELSHQASRQGPAPRLADLAWLPIDARSLNSAWAHRLPPDLPQGAAPGRPDTGWPDTCSSQDDRNSE